MSNQGSVCFKLQHNPQVRDPEGPASPLADTLRLESVAWEVRRRKGRDIIQAQGTRKLEVRIQLYPPTESMNLHKSFNLS